MTTTATAIAAEDIGKEQLERTGARIGNTPLLPFHHLQSNPRIRIHAKAEWKQLSGSVKARAAFNIVRHALETGGYGRHKVLLDATSGNTGIAYAAIGKELGLRVALCLPENASSERKRLLKELGAEIILTSRFGGTDEAQEVAAELAHQHPERYFHADQYANEQNWKAHYHGTALEILREVPSITHFVAGLGSTGTFTGTARRLKEADPVVQAISLQPDVALHGLEGWKHLDTATVPGIYDSSIADRNNEVSTVEAYRVMRQVYEHDGLLLSPSSAANLAGALRVAEGITSGTIVTVLPDHADRYGDELLENLRRA